MMDDREEDLAQVDEQLDGLACGGDWDTQGLVRAAGAHGLTLARVDAWLVDLARGVVPHRTFASPVPPRPRFRPRPASLPAASIVSREPHGSVPDPLVPAAPVAAADGDPNDVSRAVSASVAAANAESEIDRLLALDDDRGEVSPDAGLPGRASAPSTLSADAHDASAGPSPQTADALESVFPAGPPGARSGRPSRDTVQDRPAPEVAAGDLDDDELDAMLSTDFDRDPKQIEVDMDGGIPASIRAPAAVEGAGAGIAQGSASSLPPPRATSSPRASLRSLASPTPVSGQTPVPSVPPPVSSVPPPMSSVPPPMSSVPPRRSPVPPRRSPVPPPLVTSAPPPLPSQRAAAAGSPLPPSMAVAAEDDDFEMLVDDDDVVELDDDELELLD